MKLVCMCPHWSKKEGAFRADGTEKLLPKFTIVSLFGEIADKVPGFFFFFLWGGGGFSFTSLSSFLSKRGIRTYFFFWKERGL